MTPERWERVEAIFHAALEIDPPEREMLIERESAGDDELAAQVASLLEAHDGGGLVGAIPETAIGSVPALEWIGPYRVLRTLGHGGMSTVYLAERTGEGFTQRVAVKLLRLGFADPRLGHRLLSERQILAQLEHTGIARLIDGGATPEGQPYFAMEYVEGRSLTDYCTQNRLTVSERLRLFLEVCAVVHFAHQQLVVHRDLKPSNIMVSDDGRAKLLDFGIAKLLDPSQGLDGATLTLPCFTPVYASPEQIRGRQVGTPSDIYSLGVVLYEMLSGTLPFRMESASPAEMERIVCNTHPERPSVRVAQKRVRRLLEGDLDTIVLKALAKEPARRYGSAEQLADDIRRHLHGLPVRARPDSITYRLGKFVRRHSTGVVAAALVAVSLVGGTLVAGWQARRATAQRDLAADEARKAALVTALMVDLFRLSDPTATLGNRVTARELLDRGVERIEREFGAQPDVQAQVFAEVAHVYANLGLLDRAEQLARRALEIRSDRHGPESLEASASLDQLGEMHAIQGYTDAAIEEYRRAVAIRSAALNQPDTLLAHIQSELGFLLRAAGEHEEAADMFTQALETQRQLLGDQRPEVAMTLFGLAATFHDRGSFDEAERLFQNALADYDAASGRPHPMAATALLNVGMIRRLREQYRAGEPLLRSAVSMRSALYRADHPDVIEATAQWGIGLMELGRYGEAEPVLRDGLERADRSLGVDHPFSSTLREALAVLETATGRHAEAAARFDTTLAAKRDRYGDDHPQVLFALLRSARPLIEGGRLTEAEARLDSALALGDPNSRAVSDLLGLSSKVEIELRRGRLQVADSLLNEAESIARDQLRESHRYTLMLGRERAELLLELDRPDQAVPILERVLEGERAVRPPPHPRVGSTLRLLGAAYLAQGKGELAEHTLRSAQSELRELPEWHWEVGELESLLGAALLAQGRPEEALPLLQQGLETVRAYRGPGSRVAVRAEHRLALSRESSAR
jgi:serine/threonine-protein kinase